MLRTLSGFLSRRSCRAWLRQVRPQLELLEARDCPAGPQVASMSIVPLSGTLVQVNGTVTAEGTSN